MKSKMHIQVDEHGRPYIKVTSEPIYESTTLSDDPRDQLIQLFRNQFAGDSKYCIVQFKYQDDSQKQNVLEIRPLEPWELHQEGEMMLRIGQQVSKEIFEKDNPGKIYPDDHPCINK